MATFVPEYEGIELYTNATFASNYGIEIEHGQLCHATGNVKTVESEQWAEIIIDDTAYGARVIWLPFMCLAPKA